jgi:flagellar basal body-associated protein FliL
MNQTPSSPPQYEPGGDRIMIIIVLIVVTALGGMLWSFFSRQSAPGDAPEIKTRHLPPSARPDPAKTATPAGTQPSPTVPAQR